eukprot:TRINITY_DN21716_c0_g2_i1.p2 TRINITY_DN21716_c0_g2~~TRINITY_DN21716_c0_g2_i1.p2  ORF type:complete len:425 (+),score=83.48 TRINITY_DN21716_c0_g2_i1:86-1276(+)
MAAAAAAVAAAVGGALAAAGGAVVAAAVAVQFTAFTWSGKRIRKCPELASSGPLLRASSAGTYYYATVSGCRGGEVRCAGDDIFGQCALGAADPPLTAAVSVGCGAEHTVALHGDGAVSSWGDGELGRDGDSRPAVITGIPPVAFLGVGKEFTIVVTHSGDVYGWGWAICGQLALDPTPAHVKYPERIPELCGRGLRRLACASNAVVAEAAAGLLRWGGAGGWRLELPTALTCSADMRFPLRGLAHSLSGLFVVVAADRAGAVWFTEDKRGPLYRILAKTRAVAAAAARDIAVVLSEEGRLYDVRPHPYANGATCREISSVHPQLPLGLLPHGGADSSRVVLLPDHCSGKARLRLFARIAVRLRLPADPLCARLTLYAVNGVYVHGGPEDPFGYWP